MRIEILKECERMAKLYFKGKRIYTDDYIIQSISFRYGITDKSQIKDLLNEIPKTQETQKHPRNKTRVCRFCGSDITHKPRNAIYCNKRCNGKHRNEKKKANKIKDLKNENTKKPK